MNLAVSKYLQHTAATTLCCTVERFTFTGKERDEETGYGYFGARYMDHELMTMWLSVDPLADKYPGISPYAYCAWTRSKGGHEHRLIKFNVVNNPLSAVAPDGKDSVRTPNGVANAGEGYKVMPYAKGNKLYYKILRMAEQESYSPKEVIRLLEESIAQGNRMASYALASWYLNGFNTRKNYKKAFVLLQKAVQGGPEKGFHLYKDALLDIAVCYELGNGVKKNPQKAYYYYLLASINGDLQAIEELSRCFFGGNRSSKEYRNLKNAG